MTNKINESTICEYLNELFPNAHCELNYTTIFQLLIAVTLSAQTTDAAVNLVTPNLFNKYPTPFELANANIEDVEQLIKRIGLYKNKAKNIVATSKILVEKYNGEIPKSMEKLVELPGVGRKTASVVLVEGFKIPAFPVDTHVERVCKRLKIAKPNDDVLTVEKKVCRLIKKENWGLVHHQFIFFGRYFCTARSPKCDQCKIKDFCSIK